MPVDAIVRKLLVDCLFLDYADRIFPLLDPGFDQPRSLLCRQKLLEGLMLLVDQRVGRKVGLRILWLSVISGSWESEVISAGKQDEHVE